MDLPEHDPPTHRVVIRSDGTVERVDLTQGEIDEILAEWRKNDIAQWSKTQFDAAVAAGFDTGLGWSLPIDDEARNSLSELRTQLLEGLELQAWTNSDMCPLALRAVDGSMHTATIAEVRGIIFRVGNYYAGLLSALRAAG